MNDSSSEVLLRVESVHKAYQLGTRRLEILKGVSIDVREGEFLAIEGASGAGKSTLLHLIGALDLPDSGRVWFRGQDLSRWNAARLTAFRNLSVGFVFQAFHLLPELSALENVCLPARMARRPAAEVLEEAAQRLEQVGLGSRIDHRPAELSGGERQRVALARALINRPSLLLADEPTGNLDSRTGAEILDLLQELGRSIGLTLIMATHDGHVASRADRRIHILDGLSAAPPPNSPISSRS